MTDDVFLSGAGPGGVRLGPLERKVLAQVWASKSVTVRELLKGGKIQLAYTTVMTTLDRLFKKGLLDRAEEGKAFRYFACGTPADLSRVVAVAGLRRWMRFISASSLPLSCFVEAIGAHDARLLDELVALIEQKRSELQRQNGGEE